MAGIIIDKSRRSLCGEQDSVEAKFSSNGMHVRLKNMSLPKRSLKHNYRLVNCKGLNFKHCPGKSEQ